MMGRLLNRDVRESLDRPQRQTADVGSGGGLSRRATKFPTALTVRPTAPEDGGKINRARAKWAGLTLKYFEWLTGTSDEDAICDLTADLLHYARHKKLDFQYELERGQRHFEAETAENE